MMAISFDSVLSPTVRALALGQFDGVHLGHARVLAAASAAATAAGGKAAALVFSPSPAEVLSPRGAPPPLASGEETGELAAACGVKEIFRVPFTEGTAALAPEEFVFCLTKAFPALRALACGWNYTFGRGAAGDAARLAALAGERGIATEIVPPVEVGGEPVSSTRVRAALEAGDAAEAAALLGRRYALAGPVVRGRQVGRTIGFPTANIDAAGRFLPAPGVYAVEVFLPDGSAPRRGAAFFPDPADPAQQAANGAVEVHIPSFEGDLYGKRLEIALVRRLRGHHSFDTLAALAAQLARDIAIVEAGEGL
jgi:riboflavin kinase/FMN adenylyltransferase